MTTLSTHVLDAVLGTPAVGLVVGVRDADGAVVAAGTTDADGRVRELADLPPGEYRVTFATGAYQAALGRHTLYPRVIVDVAVADGDAHLHVPLLLSPFAYSTYRGT